MRAYESTSEAAADADLVLRSRSGDSDAFGELWQRHYRSGIVAASCISGSFDPDDLVQEAYTKVFQAIRRGGGPTGSFRAYLFTAIRNIAANWGRAAAAVGTDEIEDLEDPESNEEAVDAALDRSLTVTAFRSLPNRWQEVLWYTEVESMKPAEVAPLLGMKAAAVSQLAFRAREGLRESWIQAHIASVPDDSDCQWTIERLGSHTRGNLGPRDAAKADAHIGTCPRCAIVASEADQVGSRLVMVLLPLAVGVTGAGGYLASLQQSAEPVALMAMPQTVLDGASVVPGETVGPDLVGHGAEVFGQLVESGAAIIGAGAAGVAGIAGASAKGAADVSGQAAAAAAAGHGASGGAGSGTSGGAGSAASSSGGITSVAGMITAGIASLGLAAAVAAAAVLPGNLTAPGGGAQSALQEQSASGTEIAPDDALAEASEERDGEAEPPAPLPLPVKPTPPDDEPVKGATKAPDDEEPDDEPTPDEPAPEAASAPEPPATDGSDPATDGDTEPGTDGTDATSTDGTGDGTSDGTADDSTTDAENDPPTDDGGTDPGADDGNTDATDEPPTDDDGSDPATDTEDDASDPSTDPTADSDTDPGADPTDTGDDTATDTSDDTSTDSDSDAETDYTQLTAEAVADAEAVTLAVSGGTPNEAVVITANGRVLSDADIAGGAAAGASRAATGTEPAFALDDRGALERRFAAGPEWHGSTVEFAVDYADEAAGDGLRGESSVAVPSPDDEVDEPDAPDVPLSVNADGSQWNPLSSEFTIAVNATPGTSVDVTVTNHRFGQPHTASGQMAAGSDGVARVAIPKKLWTSADDFVDIRTTDDSERLDRMTLGEIFLGVELP
ncbi:sigma-70 family RNA polymerase sigma factor [Microbacterium halophytorum]|uniref:sigma-70 family RNA polymerase sigma factor n=1 Tax=Microbacterium halophytorum TaxID=2067568 RepID=UPI000CFDA0D3|nr:sigma-70 family RNA polymerase sigma factor [Microbacterium halophytorum]